MSFAKLRELLANGASGQNFIYIVDLFQHWNEPDIKDALDYANEHMRDWDVSFRNMLGYWKPSLKLPVHWPLLRTLSFTTERKILPKAFEKKRKKLSHIRKFFLSYSRSLQDISPILALEGLESLLITGCAQLFDISCLQGLSNLRSLSIEGCHNITDYSFLLDMPNISELSLSCGKQCRVTDYSFLSSMPQLVSLELLQAEHIDNLDFLKSLKELESLSIGFPLFLKHQQELASLPKLRSLVLHDAGRLESLKTITLPNLEELTIHRGSLTSLEVDENLWNLKSLSLLGAESLISFDGLEDIAKISSLHTQFCNSLRDIRSLTRLSSLKSLSLRRCPKLEEFSPLLENQSLQQLHISEIESLHCRYGRVELEEREEVLAYLGKLVASLDK